MPDGTIIVTGASRGIGAAIARTLAAAGWSIAGLSRSGASAAGQGFACDMTDEMAIANAVRLIAARGPVVGLVNNAGQHDETSSHAITAENFDRLMRLNATAVVVASREAYPHLKAAGGGLIVNIGSFFDKLGVKRNLAYCASKAAVGAITRCLAVEWAADNIRVIDVAPGYIVTDLNRDMMAAGPLRAYLDKRIPRGEPGSAEEVGRLVAALYREELRFLSGETIYIDGAQGIAH